MAFENPDDKDGTKNSGEKKYRGVRKTTAGKFTSQCGSGANRHIGTFVKAVDAARAYDERARKLFGDLAKVNFPDFHTDDNSSLATSVANRSDFPNISSEQELNDYAEYLNIFLSDEQGSESALPTATSSVCAEVHTTEGLIGSSGSTTIAVTETHAAEEEVMLPTATNNTLPEAESSVTGVANSSDSAKKPIEQEELNKYVEYLNNLLDEEDSPSELQDQEDQLNNYGEDLKNLLCHEKGSKSS